MNPKTGAVYVMASSPGFDPNLIEKQNGYAQVAGDEEPVPARAGVAAPEPRHAGPVPAGLDFKTITAAAALDDGVYKPDSTFYDPGYCTEYGKQVKNALDQSGPEAFGIVNLVEAYQHSINAVFCNIGQDARREADPRGGEEVRLLLGPAARDAADARSASGPLPQRQAVRPDRPARASRASTRAASRSARTRC